MIETLTAALMLGVFTAPYARDIPDRITALSNGRAGIKFAPIAWIAMLPAGFIAHHAAQHFTFLQWGWLGHNILVSPLTNDTSGSVSAGASTTSLLYVSAEVAVTGVFFLTLIAAFLVFNYEEESWGRETWWHVVAWAFTHLIMGIPLFAVLPIFAGGVVFKLIHDRYGHDVAFATHVTSNTVFAAFLTVTLTIL